MHISFKGGLSSYILPLPLNAFEVLRGFSTKNGFDEIYKVIVSSPWMFQISLVVQSEKDGYTYLWRIISRGKIIYSSTKETNTIWKWYQGDIR